MSAWFITNQLKMLLEMDIFSVLIFQKISILMILYLFILFPFLYCCLQLSFPLEFL